MCSYTQLLYSQINQQHGSHYHDKPTERRIEVYNAQKNRCSREGVHPVQPVPVEVLFIHYWPTLCIHLNILVYRPVLLGGYIWHCCRLICRSMFWICSLGNCRSRWLSAGSHLGWNSSLAKNLNINLVCQKTRTTITKPVFFATVPDVIHVKTNCIFP